ncbi:nuclear egress type 2 membrane protein [Wood mouse herpesvirus]|uniref:Nuclear egress type 2 membrane protein n=1 Tax=Wood mouse herpesvirus TaxID=432370 RepID=D0U1Q6_9GAMA|nr:nuclear egress type 2 membrane protein [Wood mouse herpesvirus]ACY41137.1 nuclear egress type 2 membrane protein [Wood mouse herpesvirus]
MANQKKLIDELCGIVTSFLCPQGMVPEIEKCSTKLTHFSKGGTKPVCTVRLQHGHTYHIEFVYKFWQHILGQLRLPLQPCFILTNNGLATTLKCFMSPPRDIDFQYGNRVNMACDVNLEKNSCVIIEDEDFLRFKSYHVFPKDVPIYNSMVVCRTYITDMRNAVQFFVVKPGNRKKIVHMLESIEEIPETPQQLCFYGGLWYKMVGAGLTLFLCVAIVALASRLVW